MPCPQLIGSLWQEHNDGLVALAPKTAQKAAGLFAPDFTYSRSLSIFLCISLFFLAGCFSSSRSSAPYDRFQAAMKPEFVHHLDEIDPLPVYDIDVTLNAEGRMTGVATITVPNSSPHIWDHIVFRLYPLMQQYGGNMALQGALVDNEPTSFIYQPRTEKSAVRIILPDLLHPSESVDVQLSWVLEVPTWPDNPNSYYLFGKTQGITSLPLFYPSLAVYNPDVEGGVGGWWLELGSIRGDAAYNQSSLFDVTATLPSDQIPVTSGTLITSTLVMSDTMARHNWVTGPSREFLLHTSALFDSASSEAHGTRVTSYWLPGDESSGRAALGYGVAALRIYTDKFGPYPFKEMRIAPAPLSFRGMEYPQVNLIGVETYNKFITTLEALVAHEVAHQWWYQIVHNDPVEMPWIDESIAEYSIKIYLENLYGDTKGQAIKTDRWQKRVNTLADPAIILNQGVMDFEDSTIYETIIYSKGALFYDQLQSSMGSFRFENFLRDYYERYRYQIVKTEDLRNELRMIEDENVMMLYDSWVGP